jgi:hypothetical protein
MRDRSAEVRIAALSLVGEGANVEFDLHPGVRGQFASLIAELRTDPHPDVRKIATEKKSCVFNWFASSLLAPIRRIIEDPSLRICDLQLASEEVVKAPVYHRIGRMPELTVAKRICRAVSISSNLVNLRENYIVFGSQSGEICSAAWGKDGVARVQKICGTPISQLQSAFNGGYPLIFASDGEGSFHALHMKNEDFSVASAFRITNSAFKFESNEVDRHLYALDGSLVRMFDLGEELPIGNLSITGIPRVVRTIQEMRDVIVVCTDSVEVFDVRAGPHRVLELASEAFDVWTYDREPFSLLIAGRTPRLGFADLRTLDLSTKFVRDNVPTLSFAGQRNGQTVAFGTTQGLLLADLESMGDPVLYNNVNKIELCSVAQCLFNPANASLAVLHATNEVLILTNDDLD